MINILESGSRVLFIRHHADGAFVANNIIHSDYNDREVKKGNDPLEIFSLYKLHDIISRNYESLDFDIALFHYKEIKEESDPRITFVMSKSDNAEHIATEKVPDHIQCIEKC